MLKSGSFNVLQEVKVVSYLFIDSSCNGYGKDNCGDGQQNRHVHHDHQFSDVTPMRSAEESANGREHGHPSTETHTEHDSEFGVNSPDEVMSFLMKFNSLLKTGEYNQCS